MAARKPSRRSKPLTVQVHKCADLKAALAREIRAQVKDRELRARLIERLSGEVAYGTGGGGGGVGVA
jgi:hypothetical protein